MWKSSKTKLRYIIDARPGIMFFKILRSVGFCSFWTLSRDDSWPFDDHPIPLGVWQTRLTVLEIPASLGSWLPQVTAGEMDAGETFFQTCHAA